MNRDLRRTLRTFGVCLAVSALPALSGEPRAYQTPQELRQACEPLFKAPRPLKVPKPPEGLDDDRERLFVVDYLSSRDGEMRATAVEILSELCYRGRPIRASALDPYLVPEHPADVRLIALAYSFMNHLPQGEQRVPGQSAATRERKQAIWSETINSLLEEPVFPRNFGLLARTMQARSYLARVELVKPENQRIMLRRCLHSLSWVSRDIDRDLIAKLLKQFPLDMLVEVASDWYRVEPDPRARAAFVNNLGIISGGGHPALVKLQPVIRLAARDWDKEIAATARKLLAQ